MIKIYQNCQSCNTDGTYEPSLPPGPPTSCVHCSGTGYIESQLHMDGTDIEAIIATLAEHTEVLDYIKAKVKKIWNKVKDGEPEE